MVVVVVQCPGTRLFNLKVCPNQEWDREPISTLSTHTQYLCREVIDSFIRQLV